MSSEDVIRIVDQEVYYRVGVPESERAQPQRLLLTIELWRDFAPAAAKDDLALTINYSEVATKLKNFGDHRQWRLIESLAVDLAKWLLSEFAPSRVSVEVKKFVLPTAQFVSAKVTRDPS
jgi:FolB domain-containing protein